MKTPRVYLSSAEFLLCSGSCGCFGSCRAMLEAEEPLQGGVWGGNARPRRKNKLNKSSCRFANCCCLKSKHKQRNLRGVQGGTGAQFAGLKPWLVPAMLLSALGLLLMLLGGNRSREGSLKQKAVLAPQCGGETMEPWP